MLIWHNTNHNQFIPIAFDPVEWILNYCCTFFVRLSISNQNQSIELWILIHIWFQLASIQSIHVIVRSEEVREEAIRQENYGLGSAVRWIVLRCFALRHAMHRLTLCSTMRLEITVPKCCSESPLESPVRGHRLLYDWAALLFILLSFAMCIGMHEFTLVYTYIHKYEDKHRHYIYIYIYIYNPPPCR